MSLEKDVFLAFYIIRKLMEAHKLSVEVEASQVSVRKIPSAGKPVTYMNWDKIDELYDWSAASRETLPLRELCNLVVHSYIFMPSISENGGLDALLVASDRSRSTKLYEVPALGAISLLRAVATDDPDRGEMKLDEATGDYAVKLWHSTPRTTTPASGTGLGPT
jgi:hypothetical protein